MSTISLINNELQSTVKLRYNGLG